MSKRLPDWEEPARTRLAAVSFFMQGNDSFPSAVPTLCALAEADPNSNVRSLAIIAISRLAEPLEEVAPVMLKALSSKEVSDREYAARWFGKTRLMPERAVPELVRRLQDPGMKIEAARALVQYGSNAQSAVPHLVELSKTNDPISSVAKWALFGIDREAAAEAGIKQY